MRKATKQWISIAITTVLSATALVVSSVRAESPPTEPTSTSEAPTVAVAVAQPAPVKLIKYPHPRPLSGFWDLLAKCETGGDWQNGGYYAGGLGIAQSTWKGFGGHEFAKTPAKATKEQQIIVAQRIAVDGWLTNEYKTLEDQQNNKRFFRPAVGFSGWGALPCTGGTPKLLAHEPSTVIAQKFRWGQKGRVVGDLQAIVGVKQDFVYGPKTWAAHQRYIISHGLSRDLAPANPKLKRPSRIRITATKSCPQFESLAYDAGFPKNQISIVSYLMWKESRCVPTAKNGKDPSGGSRGLLQINGSWTERLISHGVIKGADDLFDPATNLKAGFYLWTYSLMNARYSYGWEPWNIW